MRVPFYRGAAKSDDIPGVEANGYRAVMVVSREVVSPWVVGVVVMLGCGVLMDAASWATTAWGQASNDLYETSVGLWRVCNLTKGDEATQARYCVFPTELDHGEYSDTSLRGEHVSNLKQQMCEL